MAGGEAPQDRLPVTAFGCTVRTQGGKGALDHLGA